jgi:hypothetical protein
MKQKLTIEVIMNPGYSGVAFMEIGEEQAEQRWMSVMMLSVANSRELVIERIYIGSINELAEFCLS